MIDSFTTLYAPTLNLVFTEQAQEQIAQGAEALKSAHSYAELGKPDFTLAFLLLAEAAPLEEKRETLARAFERRAELAEQKVKEYQVKFRRPFPLMKLKARKDLQTAQAVRQGQPILEK